MTRQKESMSAAEAQEFAKLTVDTLKGMRNDDVFKLFFQLVESICEKPIQKKQVYQESVKHLDVWKLGKEKATMVSLQKSNIVKNILKFLI